MPPAAQSEATARPGGRVQTLGRRGVALLAVALLALGLVPYTYDIMKFLPAYSVDENDVVESAVAFTAGDLNPYWHKYGGLFAYLLAAVYSYQAAMLGVDVAEHVKRVFFDGTQLYYTARYLGSCLLLLSGLIAARLSARCFGDRVGRLCLILAAVPLAGLLTGFTVRVDTLQALWTILAIAASVRVAGGGGARWSVAAGLFLGLSTATKPLPGLVLAPTVILAHYLGARQRWLTEGGERGAGDGWGPLIRHAVAALRGAGLYLSLATAAIAFFACHPAALVDFGGFIREQAALVLGEGSKTFTPGWDVSRFVPHWGWPLTLAVVAALISSIGLALRRRQHDLAVIASFPVVLWLVYSVGAAQDHFYLPAVPAVLVVLAVSIDGLAVRIGGERAWRRDLATAALVLLCLWHPAVALVQRSFELNRRGDYRFQHAGLAGRRWIEENIPPGSTILIYGFSPRLPWLLADRAEDQATYGEHFMYGRQHNLPYQELFLRAYQEQLESGRPRYRIIYQKQHLGDAEELLGARCRRAGVEFVVSRHDLGAESAFSVVRAFERDEFPFGWVWRLYRVETGEPTDTVSESRGS
jgi:hypothetical protein